MGARAAPPEGILKGPVGALVMLCQTDNPSI